MSLSLPRATVFAALAIFGLLTMSKGQAKESEKESYQSGQALYERYRQQEPFKSEKGYFTRVLVDYEDYRRGYTPIYYHFEGGYKSNRHTVLVFDGGPGASSHHTPFWELAGLDVNILRFDGRGIGFSRPDSENIYRDPSFYSSLNTARDAQRIVQELGLKSVSVLGVSAGAVPATIFADRFPRMTYSLILWGPANPDVPLSQFQHRAYRIREFLSANKDLLATIAAVNDHVGSTYWLGHRVIKAIERSRNTAQALADLAQKLKLLKESSLLGGVLRVSDIEQFLESSRPKAHPPLPVGSDEDIFRILLRKEHGEDTDVGLAFELRDRMNPLNDRMNPSFHLVYDTANLRQLYDTANLRQPKPEVRSIGGGSFYKRASGITAPVYFLAGSEDLRTPLYSVRRAFMDLPTRNKTLVTFKGAGHCSLLGTLEDPEDESATQLCEVEDSILAMALLGEKISAKSIEQSAIRPDHRVMIEGEASSVAQLAEQCWDLLIRVKSGLAPENSIQPRR